MFAAVEPQPCVLEPYRVKLRVVAAFALLICVVATATKRTASTAAKSHFTFMFFTLFILRLNLDSSCLVYFSELFQKISTRGLLIAFGPCVFVCIVLGFKAKIEARVPSCKPSALQFAGQNVLNKENTAKTPISPLKYSRSSNILGRSPVQRPFHPIGGGSTFICQRSAINSPL